MRGAFSENGPGEKRSRPNRSTRAGVEFFHRACRGRGIDGSLSFDADVRCSRRHTNEDGCRVYLSSMLWPGWLLLSAPKWRIGFQRLHGLSRTTVHRRWRTLVPSSAFPAAAVAGATAKRSTSDCWPLADGWRLSGLLAQRSHESGPGMGIRAGAYRPGRCVVERRRNRRASAGNAARRTRLYSQVFECQPANGILRHQARSSFAAFLPTSPV